MNELTAERRTKLALAAPAITAALLVLYSTAMGIGVARDSLTYLAAAHHFASGHGISLQDSSGDYRPLRAFPPLIPLLTGTIEVLQLDPIAALRYVNAFLFAVTAYLTGLLLWRFTGSPFGSVLASFLVALSPAMLQCYTYALSEALFLTWMIAALFCLLLHLDNPRALLLIGGGALAALAVLTRFAGAALVAAGCASILFFCRSKFSARLRDAFIFGAIGGFPFVAWLLMTRSKGVAVYGGSRIHGFSFEHLNTALYTVAIWIVPESVPGMLKRVSLGLFLAGLFLLFRGLVRSKNRIFVAAAPAIFIGFYIALVGVTISYYWSLWGHHPVDARILSPVFLSLIIAIVYSIQATIASQHLLKALVLAGIVLASSYAIQTSRWSMESHQAGLGFTGRQWQESRIIALLRKTSRGTRIVSNSPMTLGFLLQRQVEPLPVESTPEALFVFLYDDFPGPAESEVLRRFPLALIERSAEGAVYRFSSLQ
jgi:hypothetical protein